MDDFCYAACTYYHTELKNSLKSYTHHSVPSKILQCMQYNFQLKNTNILICFLYFIQT